MKQLFIFLLLISLSGHATTWKVGAAQIYTTTSAVVNLVQDYDTVKFDGGVYLNDPVTWSKKGLVFIGLGTGTNRSIMRWNGGDIANGKGLWVFANPATTGSITIDNIVFEGARVSDANGGNGAGIRYQAKDLIIRNCLFMSCQNGILEGGSYSGSTVSITNTEFKNNGYEVTGAAYSGYEHSIYISAQTDSLLVQNCYFHDPRGEANSVKTRAQKSYILYNRIDEAAGQGSWEINIAQGGLSVIIGNAIIQGTASINHGIVSYDAATNPTEDFYFINNTVINKYPGNFLYFNVTPTSGINKYKVYNNIFTKAAGSNMTSFIAGSLGAALDTMANRVLPDYTTVGFVNAAANDFHLGSSALSFINNSTSAGVASNGFSLTPQYEYNNFNVSLTARVISGPASDIGAYEYAVPTAIETLSGNFAVKFYPNPAEIFFTIEIDQDLLRENSEIVITDLAGRKIMREHLLEQKNNIDVAALSAGVYLYRVYSNYVQVSAGKAIIK